jgi:2-oxoisovalerate dehydrogenase E1 component alpha subunit
VASTPSAEKYVQSRGTSSTSTDQADRVLFPGALNSEFTDKLNFIQPSQQDAIPTYRVMNQYGEIIDKEIGVETEDEEALQIYKNMVKRQLCQAQYI